MSKYARVEGVDDVLLALEELGALDNYIAKIKKACALVERSAKQKAPKGKTGELRNSISSRVEQTNDNIVGIVYTPLEYAPYVEFGTGLFAEEGGRKDVPWIYKDEQGEFHSTSGMPPSPFLRPALEENREQIKRIIGGSGNA